MMIQSDGFAYNVILMEQNYHIPIIGLALGLLEAILVAGSGRVKILNHCFCFPKKN